MNTSDENLDENRYRVNSRKQIISILDGMRESTQLLTMTVDHGRTIVTTILDVQSDQNRMLIDAAKTASDNELIASAKHILIEAVSNSIRITFQLSRARISEFEGDPAFVVDIPESLIRLQRRESFRVLTPITKPMTCTFRFEAPDGSEKKITTYLNNISAGGLALTDESQELNTTKNLIYKNCELQLADKVMVLVNLEVRESKTVTLTNGKTVNRFGMSFHGITNQTASTIQRYITQLERDQNAKKTGML